MRLQINKKCQLLKESWLKIITDASDFNNLKCKIKYSWKENPKNKWYLNKIFYYCECQKLQ